MTIALRGGQVVALSQRVYSWDDTGAVLGSAANYNDYTYSSATKLPTDPLELWRTQRSLRTVVNFLARNIAQVSMHSFMVDANGDKIRNRDTLISKLVQDPNTYMTAFNFMYALVVDYALHERFLAEVVRVNGKPELLRIPPNKWKFVRDGIGRPRYIQFADNSISQTASGKYFWLDRYPDDISGTRALQDLLNEEHAGVKHRAKMWEKGARISGVIERPSTAPRFPRAARTKFLAEFAKSEAGGDNEGKTALLTDDMKYKRVNVITPSDAQQLETSKLAEAQVAAAFGIPPVFVGLLDNANYSNVAGFRDALYGDTLGPWFTEISQAFNSRIVNNLGMDGEFVEFNVEAKLQLAFKDRYALIQKQVGVPILTPNEGRRILNHPRLPNEEYDDLVIPLYISDGDEGGDNTESDDA